MPAVKVVGAAAAGDAPEERRAFFTPASLAKYLQIGERTVYRMLSEGEIPSYKLGATRRISPTDVDAYLEQRRAA